MRPFTFNPTSAFGWGGAPPGRVGFAYVIDTLDLDFFDTRAVLRTLHDVTRFANSTSVEQATSAVTQLTGTDAHKLNT